MSTQKTLFAVENLRKQILEEEDCHMYWIGQKPQEKKTN